MFADELEAGLEHVAVFGVEGGGDGEAVFEGFAGDGVVGPGFAFFEVEGDGLGEGGGVFGGAGGF